MSSFTLTRLGPEKFEKMCQVLAINAFGAGTQVFGDGPDGGRDASFEGIMDYPSKTAPWKGYCVLEAKYKKEVEGNQKDADWLIEQIRRYLDKWANPQARRVQLGRVPDYLVVATNVKLSPDAGRGGIDRVDEFLRKRVEELGLPIKGWHLWHRDKIFRLLESNRNVREAYAEDLRPDCENTCSPDLVRTRGGASSIGGELAGYGLPRELRQLIGREGELALALEELRGNSFGTGNSVLITGGPGIGKSALALRIGHLVKGEYPDGQCHVDLSLAGRTGAEIDLVSVILHALNPAGAQTSTEPRQRTAMLRTVLAGLRVLLVIDDIGSEQALSEILGMDGPFALVCTSRAKLSGMTGLLRHIELGPLAEEHGEHLVRAVAGSGRLTEAQSARLARACGGHPLALHIAAAHLARRPRIDPDKYIEEIADPDRGVQALRAGQTAIEPVIERSFAELTPEQARLFTVLGILPYMSVTVDLAAAAEAEPDRVGEIRLEEMAELLDELVELSLIEQIDKERFLFHEVVHRFARLKGAEAAPDLRYNVVQNACLMAAASTEAAVNAIGFLDEAATVPAPSNAAALHQLDADRAGAVALVELARDREMWEPLVLLASAVTAALRHGSHWADIGRVYQCVADAGTASGRPEWTVTALINMATVAACRGDSRRAVELYAEAAGTAHDEGDLHLVHVTELATASMLINLGQARAAIPFLRRGLRYWRLADFPEVLAEALGNLGQAYYAVGEVRRAERYLRNSLGLQASGSAPNLQSRPVLGELLHGRGRTVEAAQQALQDIERARAVGDREGEASALLMLARTPRQERPETAPPDPLERALKIYRDINDVRGQVRTLFDLGWQAKRGAEWSTAEAYLEQCARLAGEIHDFEHAARALSGLASLKAGNGLADDAAGLLDRARRMAEQVGNPTTISGVLQKSAELAWTSGRIGEAVTFLTQGMEALANTEHKEEKAVAKAALGEALAVSGRWQEGEALLREVVSDTSTGATPRTRAQAHRALGVLYSRRGLFAEASTMINKALDASERAGDRVALLEARMALGNLYARNRRDAEAVSEYRKAEELAGALGQFHTLTIARTNAAICRLRGEDAAQAVAELDHLLSRAREFGLHALEGAIHNNVGNYLAGKGDHAAAVVRFGQARALMEEIADDTLLAPCLMNLARAHHALGNTGEAREHAREAFGVHQRIGEWAGAGEALLALYKFHLEKEPTTPPPAYPELLGHQKLTDRRILEWIQTPYDRAVTAPSDPADVERAAPAPGRRLQVAPEVMEELGGGDISLLVDWMATSRKRCCVCGLMVDEEGDAGLLLACHPEADFGDLLLAHLRCSVSQVITLKEKPLKEPKVFFEAECILFGGDRAGVILDCYGGHGVEPGGPARDLVLDTFREAGFTDLRTVVDGLKEGGILDYRKLPGISDSAVSACLNDHKLSWPGFLADRHPAMPLDFLPRWYEAARKGEVTILVGRNLQGMAADDDSYLLRAVLAGQVVGATVPLKVARPRRNAPCPCMMRSGRKFKHCCGRRSVEAGRGWGCDNGG
ncbi:tetratricopeptide repeat protein [Kitasatospora cineracea]|uniref:tetratricopeptide repeat protein n=1 Tax=Kitasatospora cineracea TaxID=88074 RepID=UPI003407281C